MVQTFITSVRSPALPSDAPMIASTLDEDLRCLLLACLPETESQLLAQGFEQCVDHPDCQGHKYLEGYFHAISTKSNQTVASVHPRLGCELQRQPAPDVMMAFCESFRRLNQGFISRLQAELERSPTAAPLADVLKRQAHFADLSVQVHWGEEVSSDHVAWHVDAANSFLHMAIGLQGRRALHARRGISAGRIHQNCAIGPTDGREVLWQAEGSAYLGSPCCYPHAVEYPASDWAHRIIAIQCRLHLTEDELFGSLSGKRHTALDIDPRGGTAAIVFRHFAAAGCQGFVMPRLEDVKGTLQELRATPSAT
eukprot:TRINITY_DN72091_c0_g1_i1.p1 TRINITY_DN72091_c0_g1~~TRINITY_DN72091_c0_g1_i1.p1  ORF type:complete len:310 (-),score=41.16 TRINITY_DN72091_c0_g1_i1:231-1160(-)